MKKKMTDLTEEVQVVFGVMTGEATEAGTKSLGAGDTRTQERVKSLRWQGGRNSIKGQDMRKA